MPKRVTKSLGRVCDLHATGTQGRADVVSAGEAIRRTRSARRDFMANTASTRVPIRLDIMETGGVVLRAAAWSGLSTFVFVSVIESRSDSTTCSRKNVVFPRGRCPEIQGKRGVMGRRLARFLSGAELLSSIYATCKVIIVKGVSLTLGRTYSNSLPSVFHKLLRTQVQKSS